MFKDKLVWITGASSGIGEHLAYRFKKEGARVILSARRLNELERVKKKCDEFDSENYICKMDLSNPEEIQGVAKEVAEKIGSVDVLINNGGVSQRSLVVDTPIDIDRKIMDIDYFGAVILTKAVLPQMIKNGGGHIVAISSIVGKFGFPLRSAYSAAKHALQGFFETLYSENKKNNIAVTIVSPGRIKTSVSENALTSNGNSYGKMDDGQEKGMSPDICAAKIVKSLKKKKIDVLVGGNELIMVYFRKFIPRIFFKIVQKISAP